MLVIKISGVEIRFDFSFFAVITLFLCLEPGGYGLLGLFCCFIHEAGHIIILAFERRLPERLTFYGGGISLGGADIDGASAVMLSAGAAANILTALATLAFADKGSLPPGVFAVMNLVVAAINLIPIGMLDGRRLLELLLFKTMRADKAESLLLIISGVFSAGIVLIMIFFWTKHVVSPGLLIIAGYLIITRIIGE